MGAYSSSFTSGLDGLKRLVPQCRFHHVLDIGANLGIHGLYAAKMGFKVWAVEPQQRNLIKVS